MWLMGDNRGAAMDSRAAYLVSLDAATATVPASAVTGTVDS
jgi:hypothetical protein